MVLVGVFVIGWYVADYIYVQSLPVGLSYGYDYRVDVDNVSSEYEVIVPIPVLDGQQMLPSMDIEGSAPNGSELVDTTYGLGLSLMGDDAMILLAEGSFDARNNAPDNRDDGTPILSMSSMTHDSGNWSGNEPYPIWVYSSVEGLELFLMFSSVGKSWRTEDGTFHSGYVRGGWGYTLHMRTITHQGWNQYDLDVSWVEVE